jgi:NAD(P)-dependent dehydrogenase (short-subunit alcohol dehydrogenase family)
MSTPNKTVIVTGANGAIGEALCQYLLTLEYKVIAVTRQPLPDANPFPLQNTQLTNAVIEDLSDEKKIANLLSSLELTEDDKICLVYGAAVFERVADFREVSSEVWDDALNVNLKTAYAWNKLVSDFAIRRNMSCSIVNISSQAWLTGGYGQVIAYAASKGGLVTMSKSLARILAKTNIRVNCVAPGFIDTDSMRGDLSDYEMNVFLSNVPMGRLGTALEVAAPIEFLLSDNSNYITGVTLAVAGGQIMH